MEKLCCIFNYAPLYRRSIYLKIDETFDAQFYFGDMESDIAKMDYHDFKRFPKTIKERRVFRKLLWRCGILHLPIKRYKHFLIIGDSAINYLFFIPLCHMLGKKVYAWGHGCKSFNGKMGWYNKWICNHVDVYFTYGNQGRQRLIDLGVHPDKLHVIYNSLNDGAKFENQEFCSDIIRNHFDNDFPTIFFIGRLTSVKQLDWIIDALYMHDNNNIQYNVLIIGDGEERKNLIHKVESLGLSERVWFYGECYNDTELSYLIYNVDLCVSPGNVGLTALHSMSFGTPVITHDDFESQMPEYETIVIGKTGDLYRKGDFNDFCKKIENWLSTHNNRAVLRQNCYDVINGKFNSNFQIELLKKIIV